jgi:hypothetical protein
MGVVKREASKGASKVSEKVNGSAAVAREVRRRGGEEE